MTSDPREQTTDETITTGNAVDVATRDATMPEDIPTQFRRLTEIWREETEGLSSPSQISAHPAYQQIIGLGRPVLPLIFDELESRGGQWYIALRAITGASPVSPGASGRMPLVRESWLRWGRDNGYIR